MSRPFQALWSRALLAICALSLLASACVTIRSAAPIESPANAGDGTAIPLASADGSASADPVTAFGTYDQAFFDHLVELGWTEPEALTLALTKLTEISADEHNAHITAEFPTGDTADITIVLSPGLANQAGTPTVTSAETADGFTFTVAYHVSSIASRVDSGSAAIPLGRAQAWLGGNGPALDAGVVAADDGGADVVVTAVIKKGEENVLSIFLKFLEERYPAVAVDRLGGIVQVLKAAGSLADALALNVKYKALQGRIAAAEACAKNPTNPLTIKAYRTDPGLRDRLLEDVGATRRSVKANAAAVFLSMLNEGIAKLTKQRWLQAVLGVGDAWAKENFDRDNEERVRQLEASITKCESYTAELEVDIRIVGTYVLGTTVARGTIPLKIVPVPGSTTGEFQFGGSGTEWGEITYTTTPGAIVNCGDPVISGAGAVRGWVLSGTIGATFVEARVLFAIDGRDQLQKWTIPSCGNEPGSDLMSLSWEAFFMNSHLVDVDPGGAGIVITGWSFTAADPTTGVIVAQRTYLEECGGVCTGETTFTLTLTPVR